MITEQDPCFARLRTVDVECPKCGRLRIISEQDPFEYYVRSALYQCAGCGTTWQLSVYMNERPASLLPLTEDRSGSAGAAAVPAAAPDRPLVETAASARALKSSPAKRRRSAKTPRRIVGKRRAAR